MRLFTLLFKNPIQVPALPQVPQYPCSWRAKVSKPPSVAEPDAKGGTQFEPCYHTDWLELKVFGVLQISWHSKLLAERDLTWIITEGKLWCVSQTQGIAGNSSVDVHLRKNKDRTQGEHTAWSRSHKQDSSHNKTHMYSAQGANSSICNQSNSLYERVTLLPLKKKKGTKITAGQSSHEKHYLNKLAKQCSPWDWFVTQEINELILCFKTDTGNEDNVIIANTYKNN